MFRISVTSSTLNAFVMVSQIVASPPVIRNVYSLNLVSDPYHVSYFSQFILQLDITITTIWNLDFLRSWYGYICIRPELKYQQILLLEYAIAVYPLFLILLTFILVKMHDNFAFVVWLWKPFHSVKILNTSFDSMMCIKTTYSRHTGIMMVEWI